MADWTLKEGERMDDLVRDGLKLIQRPDQFCFSMDSVLLAHYVAVKRKDRVADLGTGTGVIALLVSALGGERITAFELNPVMADIARRNVAGNHKEESISIVEGDYRETARQFPTGFFSVVLANPPYREPRMGRMTEGAGAAAARYEMTASLTDVFRTAQYLLKYGGKLAMVHRADRVADLVAIGRDFHMEPKRMRFVYARRGHTASRVLIEWKYGGGAELTVEPPLLLHEDDGSYTDEVMRIYGKTNA